VIGATGTVAAAPADRPDAIIVVDAEEAAGSSWPPAPIVVAAGRMVVATGPPGCGKSLLLRSAAGFARAPGWRARVAGVEMAGLSHAMRRRVAAETRLFYLPQTAPLVSNLTVLENILLPILYRRERDAAESAREAMEWLASSGIGWAAHELPSRLSEEDRKTAAILRGLLRRPVAALLDDPLGGLAAESLAGIMPLLRSAMTEGGCAILAAGPDLALFSGLPVTSVTMPMRRAAREDQP